MLIEFPTHPIRSTVLRFGGTCFALLSLCTGTNGFSQGKTILQGTVKQSDGTPLRNSAIMLIGYDPATRAYTVADSAYTDANGGYKFTGSMQYFVLARPDATVNDLPTYYGNALFSQKATPVALNFGAPITADFATVKKNASGTGPASLGGTISIGKNLSVPASRMLVFLADKSKNPVAAAFTNASGNFLFKNLATGDYSVWVDFNGIDNNAADVINVNALNPAKTDFHFRIEDGTLVCSENGYSGVKEALKNKEHVYDLQLNSIQHDQAENSLVFGPDGTKKLSPQIGELTNLESLSLDINMINALPAEMGKLSKLTSLSANLNKISALPAEFGNLKNLKALNLGKNDFTTFPEVVTSLSSLEALNFENNPVHELPASIGALKNLKVLTLSNCYDLAALPPQVGELTSLEELNLSGCAKIKSLPKELANLKNLKVLDITGTKLSASFMKKAVPGCEVRQSSK